LNWGSTSFSERARNDERGNGLRGANASGAGGATALHGHALPARPDSHG
jgi:hypothetical protein